MSTKTLRWFLVAGLALAASFGSVARADIDNASATNVQEGTLKIGGGDNTIPTTTTLTLGSLANTSGTAATP